MGIEGHDSPRDVASENKKHPWEIFPTDDSSANLSEKEREELKKKKEKDAKRKMQLSKTKKWINTHHILLLSIVIALIIAIGGGVLVYFKLNEKKPEVVEIEEPFAYPEDYKLKDAIVAAEAFDYARDIAREVALEGVDDPYEDTTKVEDNMDLFIDSLESDYDKLYFRLYTTVLLSAYQNPVRAKYRLEVIEAENHELDKNQRYVYYMAYIEYYYIIGDKENSNIWSQKMEEDPELKEDDEMELSKIEEVEA